MANPRGMKRSWPNKKSFQVNPELVQKAAKCSTDPKYGYYGFNLYFPDHSDLKLQHTLSCVSIFEKFIERNDTTYDLTSIESVKYFMVDYKILTEDEELCTEWTDLRNELINCTEFCLKCMGLAMHQAIMKEFIKTHDVALEKHLGIIRARIINCEPLQHIKDVGIHSYDKLISLKGTVIKACNTKLIYQHMAFSCSICTGVQAVKQPDGVFTLPQKCTTEGCRAQSNFTPLYSSSHTRTATWQLIKIQELLGGDEFESGRVPRTMECELTDDLVNSCVPGDDLLLTGVIKMHNNSESSHKDKPNLFEMYMDVVSVINIKNQSEGSYGACKRITFNISDYYAIQKIHAKPNLFRVLVQSLCPNIYGHETVKAGLLLALFGGTKCEKMRAESHVLIVGDPGLGKSQMLQACVNVAPRGVYVCGKTSTASGLTVTMTRDSGEYTLEAGAMMLADQGCCCIDEFDKIPTQHACLLEAMEQQSISIAKAGIVCTLPARTTVLAAANPICGHYNKAKSIAQNLRISQAMLSRFDLIFILLDQPNEELDMRVSEHVLAIRSGKVASSSFQRLNTTITCSDNTLKERLSGGEVDNLPHSLFRKYIAYAQKYVNPQLSTEAQEVVKEFYFKRRKQFQTGDCTPVTTRMLTSLIRLTQARAKIELREEATKADAEDVVEIMEESLMDVIDDGGVLEKNKSTGRGSGTKNQVTKLLQLMQQAADAQNQSVFTTEQIRELSETVGINSSKFYSVLDNLCNQCLILNKGADKYQLVSARL